MDQYPFGNFRDNPPLPVYVWNHPSCFSPEAQGHTIPYVMPSSFHHNQMENPYLPYTPMPVLFPADPFTCNFSFPPPLPGIQIPPHTDLHGRTFHPPLTSRPNGYFLLQTPLYQSDLSSLHPLLDPGFVQRQSSSNELSKQCSVQEKTPLFKHDRFISDSKNTECENTTVTISGYHDNVYIFQQQHEEQEQSAPQTIQDLSERLQKQLQLSGEHSTVMDGNPVTMEINMANAESSVLEGYQTTNQDESHEIQEEQIGFLPKPTVITEENAIQPDLGAPQTTGSIGMNKQSKIKGQLGIVLAQTIHVEQEKCNIQQESPAIQQELIINKDQNEKQAQTHQNNINPEKIHQTLDQLQVKKEDKKPLQNSIRGSKAERRNWKYHRHQSRRQHEETRHWQHCSYWEPQNRYPKSQYSNWQTRTQQFQQSYQNATFKGRHLQDSYQPAGTSRMTMGARFDRKGNRHNKGTETPSNNGGENKNPQEGNSYDDQKAANPKSETRRYYVNRNFKSTG